MEFAARRKEIGKLRQEQNSLPGNVRKEVRTYDPK